MIICDRCLALQGKTHPAEDSLIFERTDERIHLCGPCMEKVKEAAKPAPRKRKGSKKE